MSKGHRAEMKIKPITLTGVWNPQSPLHVVGDEIVVNFVGVPKDSPAPSIGDVLSASSVAATVRGRITRVEKVKDEEGNDAVQVTIEPLEKVSWTEDK